MKHQSPLFIISIIILSFTCKKGETKYEISVSIQNELNLLNSTPDSLLSTDLQKKKLNLQKIINDYIKVKNDMVITTATPDTFRNVNLSEDYYILLLKSIYELNNYAKENNIENLDEMINKAKTELFQNKK